MENKDLREVTRDINGTLGTHLGEFRRVANDNNKNVGNIIKDISKMFATLRRDISNLASSIEETAETNQKTAAKIDNTNNLLQESISVQHNIYSEMKNMNTGLRNLGENLQNINQGSIIGSFLDKIGLGGALGKVLLGAAAGGGASYLLGQGLNNYSEAEKTNAEKISSLGGGGSADTTGITTKGISSREKALLDAISTGESPAYNVIVGGKKFNDYSHHPGVVGVTTQYGPSTAAGRYQFVKTTWDSTVKKYNAQNPNNPITDFSPGSQDRAALFLAQLDYKRRTGRDLKSDVNSKDPEIRRNLGSLLQSGLGGRGSDTTWQSFQPRYRSASNIGADLEKRASLYDKNNQAEPIAAPSPVATSATTEAPAQKDATPAAHGNDNRAPKEHGGIISGAIGGGTHEVGKGEKNGEQGKLGTVNPDILAKFKQIQSQAGTSLNVTSGFRDPAHNAAVGGAKNSAHTRGNAVDVTFGGGIPEALKLIDTASKIGIGGIGVYSPGKLHFDTEGKRAWGSDYHRGTVPAWAEKAIQAHLSGSGGSGNTGKGETTPSGGGSDATPQSTSPVTPGIGTTVSQDTSSSQSGAQQEDSGGMQSTGNASVDSMRESFIQGMVGGGMGGGMMGMIAPMVGGMVAPSMAELSGTQATQAAMDTSMLNASIIERQMSEDKMKEMLAQAVSNQGKTGPDQETGAHLPSSQNSMAPYNGQQDNAWPSWTSMIGGYHWDELKHVKLNMWGL